ncbi:MAG: alpha/beta hydrolase [Candidatus Riflebacteria bacterium]|nr:alpha/beta hydrolase [Candidatus Riflebacteria bacterium]
MKGTTDIHPDAVLESLLAKGGRSDRRAKLEKLHEVCRKQHAAGSRDFSLPTIGRMGEAANIMKTGRSLYNAEAADYRTLIEAWAAYAGPSAPKPPKMKASHEYLMKIEDPALRSIMQSVIAERDKLKMQINMLKAVTEKIVDRRPLGAKISTTPGSKPMAVLEMSAQLPPYERESLMKAISCEYLERNGLYEGERGEILNEKGRKIFEVGFTRAIRRVLGENPVDPADPAQVKRKMPKE